MTAELCQACGYYKRGVDGACVDCGADWPEESGRDYSALWAKGKCVLCGQLAYDQSPEAHAAIHLATGECVVQYDYRHTPPVQRVLATAEVPTTDADGIGLWERDRTDANTENLRAAYALARDLNNATRARIAKAVREAK